MSKLDLSKLVTERRNPNTMNLDEMNSLEIATLMNKEDENVISGVNDVLPDIAKCIDIVAEAFSRGGRLIYIGAGTSGRLGLLDSVECPPTFGVNPEQVVGLLAGGMNAFVKAVEGAEDNTQLGIDDLKNIDVSEKDVVVGLAASGRTPYVIGAFDYANEIGAYTVAVCCNKDSIMGKHAKLAIEVNNGPEVLTGSTRLKSGTSQKMVCNMISTGSMVKSGKVYQNLMVDVMQTNEKLVRRAKNIVMAATECNEEDATQAIKEADGSVKLAITMILLHCSKAHAIKQLDIAKGHIRQAI